ncbi:MAG: GIY-YIG nuclease family protein [Alphaproteobacteria bacterium]|jgi:putative endonuclease|nr:GIY-YIG nuclease family protein [Alphaproteobacteria bacterium]MBP9878430.1 GIY-YIG nuclease family protein [Alphaproteobacteria bacterium]
MKQPAVYIVTNKFKNVFYTGVTSDLSRRQYEHENKIKKSFTSKYNCHVLIYYERHETMESAISREKKIKGMSRTKKLNLIETLNPKRQDLLQDLI